MLSGVTTGGDTARFVSWNVKGLNGPVKRARIFAHLKKLKSEIIFLQETHLIIGDHIRLRRPWFGQIFHSNFSSKSRGVAILFHKKVQFTAADVISDPNGRYIIVSGSLFHTPVILVNVYAPNWDDEDFIKKIISNIPSQNSCHLIFGGDLNCLINPNLDRSNPASIPPLKMARALSAFMDQVGCIDPWRLQNPNKKTFSFYSHVHHSYSRIDYFFIDKTLLPSVANTEYSAIVESDHAPLILDLYFNLLQKPCPLWRLNSLLLAIKAFVI
jgi:exonuclease III